MVFNKKNTLMASAVIVTGSFLSATTLSFIMLSVLRVSALDNAVDDISITVPSSCSLTSTLDSAHTETINIGTNVDDIGTTTIKVFCNDSEGFAIYAAGYTGDEIGGTNSNKLIGTNNQTSIGNIDTGIATSGATSNWSMKLIKVENEQGEDPVAYNPANLTIESDTNGSFANYHVVPNEYAKVASFTSTTDATLGSVLQTTYQAYISPTQAAGTYAGKVIYTLVHPATAIATKTIQSLTYMQEFATLTSGEKAEVLSSMVEDQQYQLKDNRDEKTYYIAKLADGNVWMTQNLDHDIVAQANYYTPQNTNIPSAWTPSTATYATNDTTWEYTYGPESYDPGDLCWNGVIRSDYDGTIATNAVACGNDRHYHIGNYYNWTAAVAMNDSSSYTTDQQDVDQSICPAGWRLPTYSGDKSYDNLITELSLACGTSGNIQNTPVYFVYGGFWDGGGSQYVGGFGYYWYSVVGGDGVAYQLELHHYGDANPQVDAGSMESYSVRCVAR